MLHLLSLAGQPLSPSALSEQAELPRSAITRVLARLEAAGYVTRDGVPSHGRRSLIAGVPEATSGLSQRFDNYARR